MTARDELREYADRYGYTEHVNKLLDAFRAEVLYEGADALEARVADDDVDTRTTWAGMDAEYLRHLATTPRRATAQHAGAVLANVAEGGESR
jgi:hypothetical protein